MTYVHADACVVIGPLGSRAEPGAHDLCADHAAKLTPPVGWELIRLEASQAPPERTHDDLLAIADAVREAAGRGHQPAAERSAGPGAAQADSGVVRVGPGAARAGSGPARAGEDPAVAGGRKHGHLRLLDD